MTAPSITTLDQIPHTAQGHYLLYLRAAVCSLMYYLPTDGQGGLNALFEKYPFLKGYFDAMRELLPEEITWGEAVAWWDAAIAVWEATVPEHLPLRALARLDGVNPEQIRALMLIGLVEEDGRLGALYTDLQAHRKARRPTFELIGRLTVQSDSLGSPRAMNPCRSLISLGLVDVLNRESPRADWELAVALWLWGVIRGELQPESLPGLRFYDRASMTSTSDLILADEVGQQLRQVPALVQEGRTQTLIVRGAPGTNRMEAIEGVALALGQTICEVEGLAPEGDSLRLRLGLLCTLTGSMPVFTLDLSPSETVELPDVIGYRGLMGVALGMAGGLRGKRAEQALSITLPPLTHALRQRHWEMAFKNHPERPDLAHVSARFHLPSLFIRQAANLAVTRAALDHREAITVTDIQEGCRMLNRQKLDNLAVRMEATGSWDDLVTSSTVLAKLQELERRCRHRDALLERLSHVYGSGRNLGVRVLFDGPSGTGKTLAAHTLAAVLEMDIYRVDLASIVNKYIGETEKNLNQLLTYAEELDVILLLDEGDSLLGKRSDVKSSNDRYANLETNYLLQRLEVYQGIVIVTTNAGENIDKAFQRRMDVVANFMPPQPQERWRIWQIHLPEGHAVSDAILQEIAVRCTFTGGQIRNVVLHAALLALDEGLPLDQVHLLSAIGSEYAKAGMISPLQVSFRQQ